jgi:hypothetical protein
MASRLITLARKAINLGRYWVNPGPREINWAIESLLLTYGHSASNKAGRPIDREGRPLPWYTYPAIEYIESMDWRQRNVFEYGSGNSSHFWAERAASVTSIEHDTAWFERVRSNKKSNHELLHVSDSAEYAVAIRRFPQKFDVIIIDGERRLDCAQIATSHLAIGGVVILDNADWFPDAAEVLRAADLIEVDFTGFGPALRYTWTTSLFMRRDFQVVPKAGRMPAYGKASVRQVGVGADARPQRQQQ